VRGKGKLETPGAQPTIAQNVTSQPGKLVCAISAPLLFSYVLGSVAYRVLHHAPAPYWLRGRGERTYPESAAMSRSFSSGLPREARLHAAGYPSASPSRTSTPVLSKTLGTARTMTKLVCEGTYSRPAASKAAWTRSHSRFIRRERSAIACVWRIETVAAAWPAWFTLNGTWARLT